MKTGVLTVTYKVDFAVLLAAVITIDDDRSARQLATFDPVGIQVAFEVYRFMMGSATERSLRWAKLDPRRHGRYPGVLEAIGHKTRDSGHHRPEPLRRNWREDIRHRLRRAITFGGSVADWRREQRIEGARRLHLCIYKDPVPYKVGNQFASGEEAVSAALDALFALQSDERRLTVQLNDSHPDARRVTDIRLHATREGWIAVMEYGFDGSSWDADYRRGRRGPDPLRAFQKKGEAFYDFLLRARRHLEKILTPACKPYLAPWWRRPGCGIGWTGLHLQKEVIGGRGVDVTAWAIDIATDREGFSPILLGQATADEPGEPIDVELRNGVYTIALPHEPGLVRRSPFDRRSISEEDVRLGRARYLLWGSAMRRAYGEFFVGKMGWKVDRLLAPGNPPGASIRERDEAKRFQDDIRPMAFWAEPVTGKGKMCEP